MRRFSADGKTSLNGYVNVYIDREDISFYAECRGKMILLKVYNDPEIGGKYVMIRRTQLRSRSIVLVSALLSEYTKDLWEKQKALAPNVKAGSLVQIISKNTFGVVSCTDCGFMQPNENISCVKCDQSLIPL